MAKRALIELIDISKKYEDTLVLDELNLTIGENEFVTLLGPSGCGKTTTLRILGGFTSPDTGGEHRVRPEDQREEPGLY